MLFIDRTMDEVNIVTNIDSWREFRKLTADNCDLLKELYKFPKPILVTGCQRSGTTMLSRIITGSDGMVKYWFGRDDELDAALILSGMVEHEPQGRYCFQTTYLDHCYEQYFECPPSTKIIWVLRNPYSTVYSLIYNWPDESFYRTFRNGAVRYLEGIDKQKFKLLGVHGFKKIMQGCYIYNWKVSQISHLVPKLGRNRIMVVDYDDLVLNKETILPAIYDFIDLEYKDIYSQNIRSSSVSKRYLLSEEEQAVVTKQSHPLYQEARQFLSL